MASKNNPRFKKNNLEISKSLPEQNGTRLIGRGQNSDIALKYGGAGSSVVARLDLGLGSRVELS